MQQVSKGNRLHIGIFGGCNSGKSSLINAITGQDVALVSSIAGTTTDPVSKAMELRGVGAVTIIDTAGYDDVSELGGKRIAATTKVISKCDIAIIVLRDSITSADRLFIDKVTNENIECILLENYFDIQANLSDIAVNALTHSGVPELLARIAISADKVTAQRNIELLGGLVTSGDCVVLVMPQDDAAPKGRLILPQVQTIRELLDKHCITLAVTLEGYATALAMLKSAPKLVICDSQVFEQVEKLTDSGIALTSFSIIFARQKGDIDIFVAGANAIDGLSASSHVLIAEACTHAPVGEDIGRVKIPAMLKARYGVTNITIVAGEDFPSSLVGYDLVIHCGACMFNRRLVMSRINRAVADNCPITNYGIAIAKLKGILDRCIK